MKKKRGELLVENIVFIILNLAFLVILILFLLKQGSGTVYLEGFYSKEIALLIDSAKPGMTLKLNMDGAKKIAQERDFDFSKSVSITGNVVEVKLTERSGDSYSFFNDVKVNAYPDGDFYILTIMEKPGAE